MTKKHKRVVLTFLTCVLLITSFYVHHLLHQQTSDNTSTVKLLNFKPTAVSNEFELTLNKRDLDIFVYDLQTKPDNIDRAVTRTQHSTPFQIRRTNNKGQVLISLKQTTYNHDNLLLIKQCKTKARHECKQLAYIELFRQSEATLNKKFNFMKQGGYTIIGRTNIALPQDKTNVKNIDHYIKPSNSLPNVIIQKTSSEPNLPKALARASDIITFMWSKPFMTGPSNNVSIRTKPAFARLKLLWQNKWRVQCADTRDIFIGLATSISGIPRVRAVGLMQYNAAFADLIANSHAVAEVYSTSQQKWILVDPWYGMYFKLDNNYLNADDIQHMSVAKRKTISAYRFANVNNLGDAFIHKKDNSYRLNFYTIYFGTLTYGPIRQQRLSAQTNEQHR